MGSPFRCDMSAIEPTQRKQHIATAVAVFRVVEEIHELPNGYAFRLPNGATVLLQIVEFVMREKLCCSFIPRFTSRRSADFGLPELEFIIASLLWRRTLTL